MRPLTNFERVEQFMRVMGQNVATMPTSPDPKTRSLRLSLIDEEVQELKDAINNLKNVEPRSTNLHLDDNEFSYKTLIEVADALTDILYVVYGAGHAFGINLDECFQEVHRSNMSKLDRDGNVIRDANGKVQKGPDFSPPDLRKVLFWG